MATVYPPGGVVPPKCACGCEERVNWMPGKGWAKYHKGHFARGKPGSRRGAKCSPETRKRMSESAKKRYAGKRRRDREETPGIGVYSTHEYQEARERLVVGRPCIRCGSTENVHAHHEIPGDDSSLVPVCAKCHPTEHAASDSRGQQPPLRERAPLCQCGCGLPVRWKRVRGWAKYRKGHGGAKVPAVSKLEDPPPCACGCGEPVAYKRGHRQRVEGHYRSRK